MKCSFFFNDTSTTEIYTTDTLFPYTTLFRARLPRRLLDGEADHIEGEADRHADPFLVHKVLGTYVVACGERVVERHRHVEGLTRSEEHTSELQSLMRSSYAVFCLKNKKQITHTYSGPWTS